MNRYSRVRKHKHQSRITKVDGITFQSVAEANRYKDLKLLEAAGKVAGIVVHPRFKIEHDGVKICTVVLDFAYRVGPPCMACIDTCVHKKTVYEDVKVQRTKRVLNKNGKPVDKITYTTDTRHSKIGRALVKAFHGVDVQLYFA